MAFSQTVFYGNESSLTTSQTDHLDTLFDAYTVFDFNHIPLNLHVKNGGDTVSFTIRVNDSLDWDFTVAKKEVFSDNFMMTYTKPNGEMVALHKGETNTYQGYVDNDPANTAYFFISKNYIKGKFTTPEGTFLLEPDGEIFDTEDYYVVIEEGGQLPPFNDGGGDITFRSHDTCLGQYPECNCYDEDWDDKQYYLELAFDMDCEFVRDMIWDKGMDESDLITAVNDYLSQEILMHVSPVYERAINMQVIGVFANWWLPVLNTNDLTIPPSCIGIDPYPDAGESDNINFFWTSFRNYWTNNFSHITRDWAHIFSGRGLSSSQGPAAGTVSGGQFSAFSGDRSICGRDNIIYQTQSDPHWFNSYSVSAASADWTTVAHGIGHGFGLSHGDGNNIGCPTPFCSCGIMEDACSARQSCFTHYPCDNIPGQNEWPFWETNHYNLCQYVNSFNPTLQHDKDACLLDPPPTNFEFEILIEDEQAILIEDDLICLNEEIDVDFFYTFGLSNFSWDIGYGLTLISGTTTDPSIRLKGTTNLTSYVCANFLYNGNQLTYCRDIHIGVPEPPAPPVTSWNWEAGNGYYSVGFPPSDYASYYDYTYTVTDNQGNFLYGDNGTTTIPDPLVWPLYGGQCVNISIRSGNECGLSAYPGYDPYYYCFMGSGLIKNPQAEINNAESFIAHQQKETNNGNGFEQGATKQQPFTIYPNPTSGKVTVIIPEFDKVSDITIIDMTGRTVYLGKVEKHSRQIELDGSNWDSGTYKVQLVQGDQIFIKKMKIIN